MKRVFLHHAQKMMEKFLCESPPLVRYYRIFGYRHFRIFNGLKHGQAILTYLEIKSRYRFKGTSSGGEKQLRSLFTNQYLKELLYCGISCPISIGPIIVSESARYRHLQENSERLTKIKLSGSFILRTRV